MSAQVGRTIAAFRRLREHSTRQDLVNRRLEDDELEKHCADASLGGHVRMKRSGAPL